MPRRNTIGYIPSSQYRKEMKHVEATEHMKFKQKPKVLVVKHQNRVGHTNVVRERQGTRVTPIRSTITITDRTNKSNLAKQVLTHELRETLYYQHGVDLRQNPHSRAQKWWGRDK